MIDYYASSKIMLIGKNRYYKTSKKNQNAKYRVVSAMYKSWGKKLLKVID